MFERLYAAFRNAWSRQGFEMVEPEFRLVAVVFSDKASYVKYSQKELGNAAGLDLRLLQYGEQPDDHVRPGGRGGEPPGTVDRPLPYQPVSRQPQRARRGLHDRPRGHAPDRLQQRPAPAVERLPQVVQRGHRHVLRDARPGARKGWAGIGVVNRTRLAQFQQYLPQRPADSLKTLISSDDRLVDVKQAVDAYAESWALTYYLIHKHPKQYVAYLKVLSRKQPLVV